MQDPKRKLPLVPAGTELSGRFPRSFERAVRASELGDARHRAVLFAVTTVARHGLRECVAPGARGPWLEALNRVRDYALTATDASADGAAKSLVGDLNRTRARLYETLRAPVEATVGAVARALAAEPAPTALDEHADRVVLRYVGLGAHLTASAVVECLDAVAAPARALEVVKDVSAAIAYRSVGLGAARLRSLRDSAVEQAEWEHSNVISSHAHESAGLALQLFHEYLGVHWKNHADAQRVYLEQFVSWVFPE